MDKNTLSNYGWIVIAVLVLSVMIALATPFGKYIESGVRNTTESLFSASENAMNTAFENMGVQVEKPTFEDGYKTPNDGGEEQPNEPIIVFKTGADAYSYPPYSDWFTFDKEYEFKGVNSDNICYIGNDGVEYSNFFNDMSIYTDEDIAAMNSATHIIFNYSDISATFIKK